MSRVYILIRRYSSEFEGEYREIRGVYADLETGQKRYEKLHELVQAIWHDYNGAQSKHNALNHSRRKSLQTEFSFDFAANPFVQMLLELDPEWTRDVDYSLETHALIVPMEEPVPTKDEDLHGGDPNCQHMTVSAPGGGIKCTKCKGWFCY